MLDIDDLKSARTLLWMHLAIMAGLWIIWMVTLMEGTPVSFMLLILAMVSLFATMRYGDIYKKQKIEIQRNLPKTLCPKCGWKMRRIGKTDVDGEGLFACVNTSCAMYKKRIVVWSRYDEEGVE